jgi:hypothetical protein
MSVLDFMRSGGIDIKSAVPFDARPFLNQIQSGATIEAVINSFLPQPHADGTPIQPSELPQSLPAYLINVVPQPMIDGQVVATGGAVSLGTAQTLSLSFYDPSASTSVVTHNVTAGNYEAIGLNPGNVSPDQLTAIQNKLAATQAKLQNNDFTNLTKDDLVGDLLNTTAIAYHAELGAMNFITARTMNVNTLTLPSETVFSTQLKVAYAWGAPQTVSPGGLNMDAKRLLSVVKSKDGNADTAKQYALSSGMTSSALEHSVPEQLFSTPDNPAQGISAVKALKIANDQGMPIYTVNQQNIATVMPQLQVDQQTKDDITNAVNAGKTVTVSQGNINFNGWIGCGYIITDPDTGAGAYMISGNLNGADVNLPSMKTITWFVASIVSVVGLFLLGPILGAIFTIAMPFITTAFMKLVSHDYTVSVQDVLLYFTSVVGWTVAGAGALMIIEAGLAASLLGILIMSLMLIPVIAADYIITMSLIIRTYILSLRRV